MFNVGENWFVESSYDIQDFGNTQISWEPTHALLVKDNAESIICSISRNKRHKSETLIFHSSQQLRTKSLNTDDGEKLDNRHSGEVKGLKA